MRMCSRSIGAGADQPARPRAASTPRRPPAVPRRRSPTRQPRRRDRRRPDRAPAVDRADRAARLAAMVRPNRGARVPHDVPPVSAALPARLARPARDDLRGPPRRRRCPSCSAWHTGRPPVIAATGTKPARRCAEVSAPTCRRPRRRVAAQTATPCSTAARDRVLHQAGDRHRAGAARVRGQPPGDGGHAVRVDVADDALGRARLADVDDRGARLDVVGRDHVGLAGGGDEDVGLPAHRRPCRPCASGPSSPWRRRPCGRAAATAAARRAATGRRRRPAGRPSRRRSARAGASRRAACSRRGPGTPRTSRPIERSVSPSTSFSGGIRSMHRLGVEPAGQRQLDEDPVDVRVGGELGDRRLDLALRRRRRAGRRGAAACRSRSPCAACCARSAGSGASSPTSTVARQIGGEPAASMRLAQALEQLVAQRVAVHHDRRHRSDTRRGPTPDCARSTSPVGRGPLACRT